METEFVQKMQEIERMTGKIKNDVRDFAYAIHEMLRAGLRPNQVEFSMVDESLRITKITTGDFGAYLESAVIVPDFASAEPSQ